MVCPSGQVKDVPLHPSNLTPGTSYSDGLDSPPEQEVCEEDLSHVSVDESHVVASLVIDDANGPKYPGTLIHQLTEAI
jgi:hypothetical protein